jgi:hypothetical protein
VNIAIDISKGKKGRGEEEREGRREGRRGRKEDLLPRLQHGGLYPL